MRFHVRPSWVRVPVGTSRVLGEQNAVVQHAGPVEDAPDRTVFAFQVHDETFHCLAISHVDLDVLHFAIGITFQCRIHLMPSPRHDDQACAPFEQPTRQEAADPTRAARDEVGSARTYDRIVVAQGNRDGSTVVHEHQFAHVPRLRHEPEDIPHLGKRVCPVRQGAYAAIRSHVDDFLQHGARPVGPFLDELREIDGMIGSVSVEPVEVDESMVQHVGFADLDKTSVGRKHGQRKPS